MVSIVSGRNEKLIYLIFIHLPNPHTARLIHWILQKFFCISFCPYVFQWRFVWFPIFQIFPYSFRHEQKYDNISKIPFCVAFKASCSTECLSYLIYMRCLVLRAPYFLLSSDEYIDRVPVVIFSSSILLEGKMPCASKASIRDRTLFPFLT